jgi:7-cyano-7-deazaguanine synthase
MSNNKKAIILFSGGLDSTTVLAMVSAAGYKCYCLSFRYGQRQTRELLQAEKIARLYQAEHLILNLELDKIGGSALTTDLAVPKNRQIDKNDNIPVTYVPARNMIFLAHAVAWGEVLAIKDIYIGVNAVDYSGYPDCRPQFIDAFSNMANLGTKTGVEQSDNFHIHTPLIKMSKQEIIHTGTKLGVDYSLTHSCYDPTDIACGICDACQLRQKGFADAGLIDPIKYAVY